MTTPQYFIGLGLSLIALCSTALASNDASAFNVGVILPLTGPSASLGQHIKNGLDFAYSKLPESAKTSFKLVYEDDGFQATRSVSAFHKLVKQDHIGAVVVVGSAIGHAIAPLAEKEQIVMLALGASDKSLLNGRHYAFLHWVVPEAECEILVSEIKRRGYKRLGIITAEQAGIVAFYNVMIAEFGKQGLMPLITLDERFLPQETDFRTFIAKMRARQIDGLIACLFPDATSALAKQLRSAGLKVDLIGLEWFEDPEVVKASEGALNGQWYVSAGDATAEFSKEYRARYGVDPSWGVPNAYDIVNILYDAAIKHQARGESLVQYLSNLKDYHGAAGTYSATADHRFSLPAATKLITKDGFKLISRL